MCSLGEPITSKTFQSKENTRFSIQPHPCCNFDSKLTIIKTQLDYTSSTAISPTVATQEISEKHQDSIAWQNDGNVKTTQKSSGPVGCPLYQVSSVFASPFIPFPPRLLVQMACRAGSLESTRTFSQQSSSLAQLHAVSDDNQPSSWPGALAQAAWWTLGNSLTLGAPLATITCQLQISYSGKLTEQVLTLHSSTNHLGFTVLLVEQEGQAGPRTNTQPHSQVHAVTHLSLV